MTQADLINRLTIGVMRDDLVSLYPAFINEALHEIQRKRSWRAMLNVGQIFTIPSGATSIQLPANFKELSNVRSPVHLIGTNIQPGLPNVLTPCDVWTRERVVRREGRILGESILNPNRYERLSIPVYINWNAEVPYLQIFYPATVNLQFDVSYFGYLPDLALTTDHNLLTDEYPEMCVAKCKATAFESINDPEGVNQEQIFLARFKEAKANDTYAMVAGMELRM